MHSQIIEHIFTISERYRLTIRNAIHAGELGIGAMHVRSLKIIAATPDCTANHIVTKLGRDKAQVARLVKELISIELIDKFPHPEDKRSQILSLNLKGKKLMEKLQHAQAKIQRQMTQGISAEQQQEFEDVAQRIAENLLSVID
jgi:DNA-binding MarR family transcriptional regulator